MILFNETMNRTNTYNINDITNESVDIIYEFSNEINNNLSTLYVTDIVLETYMDEGREVSSLIEGTVKDAISNAVNAISTFMKRIIEWFKKVYLMMTDKTNMISKYINKNDNYTKIKNNIQQLDYETTLKDDKVLAYKDVKYDDINNYMKPIVDIFNKIKNNEDIDIEKFTNKDKLKEIDDIFFDKNKSYIKGYIDKNTLLKYLEFCKNSKSLLNQIRDLEKINVNLCKEAISHLKKLENKPDNYMEQIKYCRQLLVYMQSVTNKMVSNIQSMTVGKFKAIKNIYVSKDIKAEYNDKGVMTNKKDEYGNEYKYDDNGDLIHEKDSDGTEIQYDPKTGKKTHKKYSNGYEEWYDPKTGKVIHKKHPDGYEEWYEYDPKTGKINYTKDSDGRETWYDPKTGEIIHFKNSDGGENWYDPKTGKATRIKYPDGYEIGYNPKTGKKTYEKKSSGSEYKYNDDGKINYIKDSEGTEAWIKYDSNGKQIYVRDSNGKEKWYDPKTGKTIHEKDSNGKEKWYDKDGKVIKEK